MFCPQCGYKNDNKAKFCEQCGIPLKEQVVTTTSNTENKNFELTSNTPIKKNKKTKVILIIVAAVLLIGLVVGGYFLITHQQKANADEAYAAQISAASQAENTKNYDAAITDYQAAIQQRPEDANAYIGLADAYIGKNDYENAAKILQNGYIKTKSTEIASKLSEVNKKLEKIKAADAAEKKAEDEAKAKETEYNSQLSEADKVLNTGNTSSAQQLYQKAIALKRNDKQVYLDIASRLEKRPDLDDALKILIQGTKNVDTAGQQTLQQKIAAIRKKYKPSDLLGKSVSEIKKLFGADFREVGHTQSGGAEFLYDDQRTPYEFECSYAGDNIDEIPISTIEATNIGDEVVPGAKLGMTFEHLQKVLTGFQESEPYLDQCGDIGGYVAECKSGAYTIVFEFQNSKGPCTRAWVAK